MLDHHIRLVHGVESMPFMPDRPSLRPSTWWSARARAASLSITRRGTMAVLAVLSQSSLQLRYPGFQARLGRPLLLNDASELPIFLAYLSNLRFEFADAFRFCHAFSFSALSIGTSARFTTE